MVWMTGADGLGDWFNRTWLAYTGRRLDQELGDGWTASVHADDRELRRQAWAAALDRRQAFQTQYRLRRHDGRYRWVLDSGAPRFGPEGFAGYVGCCIVLERPDTEDGSERGPGERAG
jgi:PAS domain S-box-containing protein